MFFIRFLSWFKAFLLVLITTNQLIWASFDFKSSSVSSVSVSPLQSKVKTKATEGQTWTFNAIGAGVITGSPPSRLQSGKFRSHLAAGLIPLWFWRLTKHVSPTELETRPSPTRRQRIRGAELPTVAAETGGSVSKVVKWPLRVEGLFPAALRSSARIQAWQPPPPIMHLAPVHADPRKLFPAARGGVRCGSAADLRQLGTSAEDNRKNPASPPSESRWRSLPLAEEASAALLRHKSLRDGGRGLRRRDV